MPKPTLTHIVAADGSRVSIATRVVDGLLRLEVRWDKSAAPFMVGVVTARKED